MLRKNFILIGLFLSLSFTSCGTNSSKEAREKLQKILQFIGIPTPLIAAICQDENRNGMCGNGELFTKILIKKGDSIDDILRKISITPDGRYFLETYNPTLPILVELQDIAKVKYDNGKFTLPFNGFKTKDNDNEVKEISILEAIVDANVLTDVEANEFKNLNNSKAQDTFYLTLLDNFEKNINSFRAKGLDSKTAVSATIREIGNKIKINDEQVNRINACNDNQECIDKEVKRVFDDIVVEPTPIPTVAPILTPTPIPTVIPTPTPTITPTPTPSTAKTFKSTLRKTGQTTSYEQFDDAFYNIGLEVNYYRVGETVIDETSGLQWENTRDVENAYSHWSDSFTYCQSLQLEGYNDWRVPTLSELRGIVDSSKTGPALNSIFTHVSDSSYWASDEFASDTTKAWYIFHSYDGHDGSAPKDHEYAVRCVR